MIDSRNPKYTMLREWLIGNTLYPVIVLRFGGVEVYVNREATKDNIHRLGQELQAEDPVTALAIGRNDATTVQNLHRALNRKMAIT